MTLRDHWLTWASTKARASAPDDDLLRRLRRALTSHLPAPLGPPRGSKTTSRDPLASYLSGDPDAFHDIVEEHAGRLHAWARRKIGNQADDALQEAFLALIEKAPTLEPDTDLGAWLFGAVRYEVLRRQRERYRREPVPLDALPEPSSPEWQLDRVLINERREQVLTALEASPNVLEQEVLFLTFDEDLAPKDIARRLDLTANHVRQLKFRAIKTVRKALGLSS
ncbi:MAG: sigma-70 family RNA polymerase sigma factor [Acidobacteriota bacterium]